MPNINKVLKMPAFKGYNEYGAKFGRHSQKNGNPEKLYLQKLILNGDYDVGGAYWGYNPGIAIYCVFNTESEVNGEKPIMVFVRAKNRSDAKEQLAEVLEGFTFHK